MKVLIYIIGGGNNDQLLGTAHDATTALNLIRLSGIMGASAVSLHGPMNHGHPPLSGEMSLSAATKLFQDALAC